MFLMWHALSPRGIDSAVTYTVDNANALHPAEDELIAELAAKLREALSTVTNISYKNGGRRQHLPLMDHACVENKSDFTSRCVATFTDHHNKVSVRPSNRAKTPHPTIRRRGRDKGLRVLIPRTYSECIGVRRAIHRREVRGINVHM